MPRAARDIVEIPGIGGHLQVHRLTEDEHNIAFDVGKLYEGFYLEIADWRVRHKYIWAKITHSGSNGALKRALVAQDFEFTASLPWNAREQQDPARRQKEAIGFIENILLGNRGAGWNVSILFALGDALHYPDTPAGLGLNRRAVLHAKEVALEQAEVITDSTGIEVVRVNVRGQGNSLLQGYRGTEIQFNDVTDPAEPPPPLLV